MMKVCAFIFICCWSLVVFAAEEKYTAKFDNVNLDDILASDRLLENYVKCLKGTGKCTPEGSELKRVLPDALETECVKCSASQREASKKVITHLITKRPAIWKQLEEQYDPTGAYRLKYQKEYKEITG